LYVTGVGLITSNLRLGGPSSTAAGNANDPAITVGGYTNAGVYFENSGVGLGAGTNKYLFLDSNGDVDIKNRLGVGGTHSGSYGLYVHGTSYLKENCVLAGNLFFGSTSGSFINQDSFNLRLAGDNGVKLQTYSGGWQDRLVIADDGDINIAQRLGVGGAHSDSYQLYVNGTSRFINAGLFQNNGSGANDHSELNIFKNAGDNTSSAILRVGYDSNSAFVISRQRASSSIYLNSAQSGSTVYHQVNEDTIFTVDGSNVLFYKSAEFDGGIKDKDGQLGSSGQVLKSTGSDVDWDTFDWEDLPNISSLTALP
jgi:frataxin-like iron-binding protein CyaY